MRKARRPSGRRAPARATASGRGLRRSATFEDELLRQTSLPSSDEPSPPQGAPNSAYVPYTRASGPAPRFPRLPARGAGQRAVQQLEAEEDELTTDYSDEEDEEVEEEDNEQGVVDDADRADGDLLYVDRTSETRQSLTMPETLAIARDKLRKRWSFHSPKSKSGRTPERSGDSVDGSRRLRSSTRSGTYGTGDFPSSSTASSSSRLTPIPDREIEVQVRTWVLEGNGSGLRKTGKFGAWRKKNEPHKTVRVLANPCGLDPMCLYASDQTHCDLMSEPYKETEFITSQPEYIDKRSIVYRDSKFEIGVVGMSVSPHDFALGSPDFNELLMFSLQRDPSEPSGEGDALPFIHYDPSKEDKLGGTEPDQFIPIPASKSLFMASDGKVKNEMPRRSVNCRFKVLELDRVDDFMQMSLSGIEQLGNHIAQFSTAAPLLGLLSPAISLASTVSRRALESHAKPDKVLTIDMNFLLAERRKAELKPTDGKEIPFEQRSGEYLRFGYYFFLDQRVDAKLYASFRTFPNVQLMLKRTEKTLAPGEKRYFPLTGVSYLVIRVTPRVSSLAATRNPIRMSHVQRLEDLMRTSLSTETGSEDAKNVVKTLAALARDVGIGVDEDEQKGERERFRGGDSASS